MLEWILISDDEDPTADDEKKKASAAASESGVRATISSAGAGGVGEGVDIKVMLFEARCKTMFWCVQHGDATRLEKLFVANEKEGESSK